MPLNSSSFSTIIADLLELHLESSLEWHVLAILLSAAQTSKQQHKRIPANEQEHGNT